MLQGVGEAALIVPLLPHGQLLLLIVFPVAYLTLESSLSTRSRPTSGSRASFVNRRFSFSTGSVILIEKHLETLHHARIAEW